MFDQYSFRAKRVVYLTRLKAGRRGAPALEPAHLVEALVLEDQGEFAEALGISGEVGIPFGSPGLKPSRQFFTAELASQILPKLERLLTKSEPIPDSTDMPASPALSRTFDAAITLSKELGHKQVEPLHLLAAALSEPTSKASEVLNEAGVTREGVIAAMRAIHPDEDA